VRVGSEKPAAAAAPRREHLTRVIAVVNGKGGVLKTSLTANVGGQLARRGFAVLLVDLDVSGNLKLDLGMRDPDLDDHGRGVFDTIMSGGATPLQPITDAGDREGLDFIFGGRALELIGALAHSSNGDHLPAGSVPAQFATALADLCATREYDVVLLDCPPGNGDLQDMALAAARWVLIPTKTDEASLDGFRGVGPRIRRARATNPELAYLGVVITSHNRSASRVLREVRARLDEVSETVPMFETTIRHSQGAAHDCRQRGQLASELAVDADAAAAERLSALRSRGRTVGGATVIPMPTALSATADDLAGDYEALTDEILTRIATVENAGERGR
jgi:chromosome partitioning protein